MEQRIILETDRLLLREMNIDDFDALYKFFLVAQTKDRWFAKQH